MNTFQKTLIEEHASLLVNINNLNKYVSDNDFSFDNTETVNITLQHHYMREYACILENRMSKHGIEFDGTTYYERVAHVKHDKSNFIPKAGNDYDLDKSTISCANTTPVSCDRCKATNDSSNE